MNVKRRLSDDEIAKIIEEMGPTPIGMRVETSATTLYDLALELRDRRLPTGYVLPAGQAQSAADYPELVEALRNKPTPVEALAERLAKVEEGLAGVAAFNGRLHERFGKSEHAFVQNVIDGQHYKLLNERIDKVAEIIGDRVSGLVERLDALEGRTVGLQTFGAPTTGVFADYPGAPTLPTDDYEPMQFNWEVAEQGAAAFPTGGSDTAEAAADAVLPVPQRGDRVRLEGARSVVGSVIADGWYDVLGFAGAPDNPQFQIRVRDADLGMQGIDTPAYSPWLFCGQPSLKEVTRNAST
jgi:hypothetical protein